MGSNKTKAQLLSNTFIKTFVELWVCVFVIHIFGQDVGTFEF